MNFWRRISWYFLLRQIDIIIIIIIIFIITRRVSFSVIFQIIEGRPKGQDNNGHKKTTTNCVAAIDENPSVAE